MVFIYDLEIANNFFCGIFKNVDTGEEHLFVIYDTRNDIDKLVEFINDENKWLVGFNSFSFDNQILNYIYKSYSNFVFADVTTITLQIYKFTQILIDSEYRDLAYDLPFKYLDLMKLGGILKSLKLVGVSLKWPKLQDLPYHPNDTITDSMAEEIIKYNRNDVLITLELYKYLLPEIRMRYEISKQYKINAYSESRSGLANRLLEKFYHETTGIPVKEFKKLRTYRDFIPFRLVIFDYIKFNTPELDELYEDLMHYNYYKGQPFFSKVVTFKGIKYKMGFGGIHSVDKAKVFRSDNDTEIIDFDFGSYYPSIIINNKIKPEHLEYEFLNKYKEIRDLRLKAKHKGDNVVADALKITINSTFGKMLYDKHWLYDPLAGLRITVNGQLLILMLVEQLELAGIHVISANTDGIVAVVTKDKKEQYLRITDEFAKQYNYDYDYAYYQLYIRKDVNNYLTIKTNGDIKMKGIFSTKIDITKGYTNPIVSKALYEYFVNSIPIEDTIYNSTDIYDFCTAKKIGKEFNNIIEYIDNGKLVTESLQKSVRYYVSKSGVILSKIKENSDTKIQYESRITVTIFNDYVEKDMDEYDIDYSYYIRATRTIINEIEEINKQLTLF